MKTLRHPVKINGIGIHSGIPTTMVINPSNVPGIYFYRTDLGGDLIPATYDNVYYANLNTTIGKCPQCVRTIEHLMSALFICGIIGAVIEIDGPEIPILDGSAKQFIEIFKKHVISDKKQVKRIIVKREIVAHKSEIIKKMPVLKRAVLWLRNKKLGRIEDGFVKLSPSKRGLVIGATLEYPDKIIGKQSYEYMFNGTEKSREIFIRDIASARTFGKISEWEYLKKHNMGRGANKKNVIALNDDGTKSLNGLKWPNEFVRHKIIDALGDLYLSGGHIVGEFESYKGSHALNNLVLRKLFSNPENYDIVE